MKLALIPPPANADFMLQTDYQLVLPSYLDTVEYARTVQECHDRGDFIILDNGVAEGVALDNEEDLYKLATEFNVNEVVIPDVYGDAEGTLRNLHEWKFNEDFRHMAVLAAQTRDEVMKLLDVYCDMAMIDTIGVPRLLWDHGIDRAWVAGLLFNFAEHSGLEIHFLGMNPQAMYEMEAFPIPGVRGVDTSAPFVYGSKGVTFQLMEDRRHYNAFARASDYDTLNLNYFNPPGWGSTAATVAKINVDYLKGKVDGTTSS